MSFLKRLFSSAKTKKRGFTIVEAVVAMAVIAIVSAAATSTVRRTLTTTGNDFEYDRARVYTENALEAFKFSDNIEQFNMYVVRDGFSADAPLRDDENNLRTYCSFHNHTNAYSIDINVSYPENGRPHFTATVYGGSKLLIQINYDKGG